MSFCKLSLDTDCNLFRQDNSIRKTMDPAVFVYYVSAVSFSGEAITKKGNVALVR